MSIDYQRALQDLQRSEIGFDAKDAPNRVAMIYPSPYRAAASSLGYQAIAGLINDMPGFCVRRAILPERDQKTDVLRSLETQQPVSDNAVAFGFSVAYELEIAGVIDCLDKMGLPALAEERDAKTPIVFAGGPLTFSNPAPLGPFFDIIIMGEGEELIEELLTTAEGLGFDKGKITAHFAGKPGFYVPSIDGDTVPKVAKVASDRLPASSRWTSPHAELSNMFLIEAVRGCSRGCNYCVMRRSTNGGMRIVSPETILTKVPESATRVGLVGASVTDHPKLVDIVSQLVDRGHGIGISSLRADRLTDDLVKQLARGGYRTLTVAADGASHRLRLTMDRRTNLDHLCETARLAKKHGLRTVKLYMMLGLPSETDEDLYELVETTAKLRSIHPSIAFGVAPFVAKRNTPLDGAPFAGIKTVEKRLKLLRKLLRGQAEIRPISVRWAWVEYMIAQEGQRAGHAILQAHRAGGSFKAYKDAFAEQGCQPTGPVAKVPSAAEKMALHQLRVMP